MYVVLEVHLGLDRERTRTKPGSCTLPLSIRHHLIPGTPSSPTDERGQNGDIRIRQHLSPERRQAVVTSRGRGQAEYVANRGQVLGPHISRGRVLDRQRTLADADSEDAAVRRGETQPWEMSNPSSSHA